MGNLYMFIHFACAALAGWYFIRNERLTAAHERVVMGGLCLLLGPIMAALAMIAALADGNNDRANNGRRGGE